MKKIFSLMSLVFISMIVLSTSVFAQSDAPMVSSNPWIIFGVSVSIFIWEKLVAMNKNVKSNSTIDLIISGLKKFFGIK